MKQKGFSFIELLVTVGILTAISIMIFTSYPEFSQRTALKRTSEEVALIVRQAQAYSLGIKMSASGNSDFYGFGVHFDKNEPKSLILFTDSDGDKTYNSGELFQEFKIENGNYVSELQECYSTTGCALAGNTLDVVYPRASSMATVNNGSASYARVTIKSPRENEAKNKKNINIWINGQISVE